MSILGCDNRKHPPGLARRCLVNLFFWRREKTWGPPESERRGRLGAGVGSPHGSLGRGTGSGMELSGGSEAGQRDGRISHLQTMTHPGNPSGELGGRAPRRSSKFTDQEPPVSEH